MAATPSSPIAREALPQLAPAPPHSPLSSNSHLSPRLLTPDSDHTRSHVPFASSGETLTFAKQPIPPIKSASSFASPPPTGPLSAGLGVGFGGSVSPRSHAVPLSEGEHLSDDAASDSGMGPGYGTSPGRQQHLSLLTAILSSPEHQAKQPQPRPTRAGVEQAGKASAQLATMSDFASNPSTALSSPQNPPHGILQTGNTNTNTNNTLSLQRSRSRPQGAAVSAHAIGAQTGAAEKALAPAAVLNNPPPSSILRRGSASGASDAGPEPFALGLAMTGMSTQGEVPPAQAKKAETEKRERIGWADVTPKPDPAPLARAPSATSASGKLKLSFAVARPPSHGSGSASEASEAPIKRTPSVAASTSGSNRRSSSPFAKERKVQESLDERASASDADPLAAEMEDTDVSSDDEVAYLPGYVPRSTTATTSASGQSDRLVSPKPDLDGDEYEVDDSDEESDLGYQEDEEDGMFSDEEETTAFDLSGKDIARRKFAFARSTNYFRGRRRPSRGRGSGDNSPLTTPPSAPSFFPPPNRRGRGHIRVATDAKAPVGADKGKGCTRHCSPPPSARSRAASIVEAPPPAASPSAARMVRRVENEAEPDGAPAPRKMAAGQHLRVAVANTGGGKMKMGSPMPQRIEFDEDEDEEDEEDDDGEMYEDGENDDEDEAEHVEELDDEEDNVQQVRGRTPPRGGTARSGWRSDDSVFYGKDARAIKSLAITTDSTSNSREPPTGAGVFESDDEAQQAISPSQPDAQGSIVTPGVNAGNTTSGDGVRNWIRRASEHLPMFRRPSSTSQPPSISRNPSIASAAGARSDHSPAEADSRRGSRQDAPAPPPAVTRTSPLPAAVTIPAPPALDSTPITGVSVPRAGATDGLAWRLEKTLAIAPADKDREAGGRGSVPPPVSRGVSTAAAGVLSQRPSLPEIHASQAQPPSAQGPSQQAATVGAPGEPGLNRTVSLSGKVTFQPAERPARDAPRRAVSGASHHLAQQSQRNMSRLHWSEKTSHEGQAGDEVKSAPIKCPKKVKAGEDLGWSDEALLNIRKKAGKVEQ